MTALPRRDVEPVRETGDWGVGLWAVLFAASWMLTLSAIGVTTAAGPPFASDAVPPRVVLAGAFVLPASFIAASAWVLLSRSRRPIAEVLHLQRPVGRDIAVGAAIGFVLQILIALLYALVDVEIEQQIGDELRRIVGAQRGVLVVLVAVMAPLAEELFFRVILLDALLRRVAAVWAVVLQGAIFGAIHVSPLPALPALAVAGTVFGFLFARGRSVWCCVAAHMAFNSLAVVALLQ